MNPIRTPRLILRPLRRSDLRAVHRLYSEPELMRYITGHPRTPRQSAARLRKDLKHHREYGFGLCLALWAEDGRPIGRCGLEPVPTAQGLEGEAAWMFAREWWGRGLATEAGRALIEFGLGELGLRRVYAEADRGNPASLAVMRRLGMRAAGERGDTLIYEALRDGESPWPHLTATAPVRSP
ncbi:MAG: GNAT family N-acetyltransferase [Gemmatimonadetes bacterium]|nr:GNAT family N-acetyltransferase [Gemmatimonadota bacterium]